MKFIQLHSIVDDSPFYLNMQNVENMEWISKTQEKDSAAVFITPSCTAIETSQGYTRIKMMNEDVYCCKETTVEILLKMEGVEEKNETC